MSLPSLKALQAFEAVARLGSVSLAAEELHVTQPAVSQQLRLLSSHLGVTLLQRRSGGLHLTDLGQEFARRLSPAFFEIRAATESLLERDVQERSLTVAMLATLAERWMIPRLASFQALHPEIDVRLLGTSSELVARQSSESDLMILTGTGIWPGLKSWPLFRNCSFPVISPELQARLPLRHPEDLEQHTLLQVDSEPRRQNWSDWLSGQGLTGITARGTLTFSNSSHAIEAALSGLGVAMGHDPFVADALAAGRLLAPFDYRLEGPGGYHLVCRQEVEKLPKVALFRSWLLAEVKTAVSR
ncbi:LysR substrate-binding domain-containing protein [Rhodovibrionaceae bacterium A322]